MSTSEAVTMYKPKESLRWYPKVNLPIRLEDQCLNAVVSLLSKTGEKMEISSARNSREKKSLREYLHRNLPVCLQNRVLDKAVDQLIGVNITLNILDMFEPKEVARQNVDLLGPFRLGFGCYVKDNRLTWSQGAAKKFNLNVANCDQLYKILLWSKPSELKEFTISIARDTIKQSKLPNILAQARSLTKVTLLSGAENHTLRILGINCPFLSHLDVSHSVRVNDQGLRNLLLKRPRRKNQDGPPYQVNDDDTNLEANACADTILCITLLGTSVTWEGCDVACKVMNFGYLCSSLPLVKIVRVNQAELRDRGVPYDRRQIAFNVNSGISDDYKAAIATSIDNALLADELKGTVVDYYHTQEKSLVFLRQVGSFKLALHFGMDSTLVTSLVLPWYSFTWKLDSLMELDTLGVCFPNLKNLRGRIRGVWNRQEKFLPHLQHAVIWSLNSTTGLSFLQHASSLVTFEFNNTTTLGVEDQSKELTDHTLEACLNNNTTLTETLQEITIRPSSLTLRSLQLLILRCPNILRIGDLEAWKVTSGEVAEFNRYLDAIRSQCILTIMNFPPPTQPIYSSEEI